MGLADELRSRNTSSPYNTPIGGGTDPFWDSDLTPTIDKFRRMRRSDEEQKAQFQSDLSLRHNRLQAMLDPETGKEKSIWANPQQNTVFKDNNPDITPVQSAEIGMKGKELGLQTAEMKQRTQESAQKQSLAEREFGLEQQKNKQIYDTKQADMQRKIEDSNNKLALAQEALNSRNTNAQAQIEAHKALQAAVEERHKLELAQKDMQFSETKRMHDAQIKNMQDKLDATGKTTTTTEENPEGNKRITTTTKGTPKGKIKVIGPKGETGTMDAEELKDFPNWKAAE